MKFLPVPEKAVGKLDAMHDQWGKEVQTIRGGTQVGLRDCPDDDIKSLMSDLSDLAGQPIKEAWSIRMNKGDHHIMHHHPEGKISGCYYLRVGEGGDLILGGQAIKPLAGMLILFPSNLMHGTTIYEDETPRLTVAFDI